MKKKRDADCPNFVETPTNPEICGKWIKLPHREPFCQVEKECESMGFRRAPRMDQESDSEE
jgi:hypothetical protein